jgi:uncharacterized 2Fe-2S/4Fe-4S cluster protein (DUF4445 family)
MKPACQVTINDNITIAIPDTSKKTESVAIQKNTFITENPTLFGREQHRYGIALDIGTTTLAAELHLLENSPNDFAAVNLSDSNVVQKTLLGVVSCVNPQRNFGDDVISRIQRIIEEPSFLAIFQTLIVRQVNDMIESLSAIAGISATEISLLIVSGNTVMEHIFLGIDPSPLGCYPFVPPCEEYSVCSGGDIGIMFSDVGVVETLPIFSGFVGGDLVSGVLATGMNRRSDTTFLLDIGTNGELVLCHEGEFYTSATAAGPAFEGGRIEYGMAASSGAIDHVTLRDGGVEISTIDNKPPVGICGSGLMDVVCEMLKSELILPNGRFNVTAKTPFLSKWRIVDGHPVFVLVEEEESGKTNEAIVITQKDIRQVQLAAGAIRAGIKLLLRHVGLEISDVSTFYVAGGFGSFIRFESACCLGLIPSTMPPERVKICGNTSLAGARMALFDARIKDTAKKLRQHTHPINLAEIPDFSNIFAEQMIFNLHTHNT